MCLITTLELDLYISEETIQASRDAICLFKTERKNTHLSSSPEFLVLRITFIFDLFVRRLIYSRGLFPVRRWSRSPARFPRPHHKSGAGVWNSPDSCSSPLPSRFFFPLRISEVSRNSPKQTPTPKLTCAVAQSAFLALWSPGGLWSGRCRNSYYLIGEWISHFRKCNYTISLCVYRQISQGHQITMKINISIFLSMEFVGRFCPWSKAPGKMKTESLLKVENHIQGCSS